MATILWVLESRKGAIVPFGSEQLSSSDLVVLQIPNLFVKY